MMMRMGAAVRARAWIPPVLGVLILGVGSCSGGGGKLAGHSDADGSASGSSPVCSDNAGCAAYRCGSRCEEGRCIGGVVCTNPDVDHCTVSCESSPEAGASTCVAKARDMDGDGHGDARCEAAAGDDCNDTDPTVFAGADEKCDGLDNDCDGLVDSFDDLPLGGRVVDIATETTTGLMGVIATPSGYAVERLVETYLGAFAAPAVIHLLDAYGVTMWNLGLESPSWNVNLPELSMDGSQLVFAALMGNTTIGGQIVNTSNGHLMSQVAVPQEAMDVATTSAPSGGWIFGWTQATTGPGVYYASVTSAGVLGTAVELRTASDQASLLHLATGASNYGAIWLDYSFVGISRVSAVRWAVFTPSSATPLPDLDSVVTPGGSGNPRPQIAATNDGFATGWFDSRSKLEFARFKANGTPICGPVSIDGAASWGFGNSVISDGTGGILAAIVDANGQASLVRIDDHCTVSTTWPALNVAGTVVASGTPWSSYPVPVGQPAITRSSDGHVACTWVEQDAAPDGGTSSSGTQYRYMLRIMSSRLCD